MDKIVLAKVARLLSLVNLNSMYIWAIINIKIDVAKDLRLTDIKKYSRYISQISEVV